MLILPQPPFRRYPGKPRLPPTTPTPPGELLLVAASIVVVQGQMSVQLTFNQAVDVSGFNAGGLILFDGAGTHAEYVGSGVSDQPTPATMVVSVEEVALTDAPTSTLNVSPPTGIVAVSDGSEWGGVEELALPFPN